MAVFVFDFDGVIVDSFDVVHKVNAGILESFGLPQFKDTEAFRALYDDNFFDSLIRAGFPEDKMGEYLEMLRKNLPAHYAQVGLFDDMGRILKELSKIGKVIIVTSNVSDAVRSKLEMEGLDFEVLGAESGLSKVDKIRSVKDRFASEKVCYVGDTVGDVKEGKQAGVVTVAVSWGYHNKEHLRSANPDFLLDSPQDLISLGKNL